MKKTSLWLMILQVPIDFVMLVLAAASAYYLRFTEWATNLKPVLFELSFSRFLSLAIVVATVWILVFAFLKLYSPDPNRKFANTITRIFFGCSIGLSLIALYIIFTQDLFASRFLIAVGWALAVVYVVFGRLLIRGLRGLLYRLGYGLKRVVIIGEGEIADNIKETLQVRDDMEYKLIDKFNHFDEFVDSQSVKQEIDEIIFTNPKGHKEQESIEAIEWCNENHVVFKYSADMFSAFSTKMDVNPLAGVPIVEIKRTKLEGWGRVIKRLIDIFGSVVLIIITSPVMLILTLVLYLESGGPVIYKNKRVGEDGVEFLTLKFRSYYPKYCIGPQFDQSHNKTAQKKEKKLIEERNIREGPIYKVKNDPRVTPVGKFLREWSLDELPQFFNVLQGEMSLVGPRPHQPEEVDQYDPKFRQVLSVKPGVTGLAQISGRSDLSFEEEMRLDVFYIRNWSLFLDFIVMIKTPFVVLFKSREAV